MNKLTENYFQSGNVLYADELNSIISKINSLIDLDVTYDDAEIRQTIATINDNIQALNNTANAEKDRLDGVIDDIDATVSDKVNEMLQDKDFLDELKEGIQSSSNFGDEDVDSYLQQIGIITRDGNNVSYGWSSMQQDVNSIRQSVNNLIENDIDTEAIQSQINQYVDDAIANLDISTMYAKKDAESIIEWMYSVLKQSTSADKTFNEIASAGKSGLSSAISELRTYVEKLKNGDYVATASLEASVDNAIAGLKASASSNSAKTEIFNKIDKNSDDIAGIVTSLTGNSSSASISTKIGNWKAGLVTESYVDDTVSNATSGLASTNYVNNSVSNATSGLASTNYVNSTVSNATSGLPSTGYVDNKVSSAVAGLMAASDFTSASVIAKVNEGGSSVKINADRINIDSSHQLDLSSQNISVNANNINLNGNTWAQIVGVDELIANKLTAGTATFNGTITSTSGTIGGFKIGSNYIGQNDSSNSQNYTYIRNDGFGYFNKANNADALEVHGATKLFGPVFTQQSSETHINGSPLGINAQGNSGSTCTIGNSNNYVQVNANTSTFLNNVKIEGKFEAAGAFVLSGSSTFIYNPNTSDKRVALPSGNNATKGQVIFTKGTVGNLTLTGSIRDDEGNTVSQIGGDRKPRIFVYDGTYWNEFYCG